MRIAVCVAAVPNPDKVKWDRFRSLLDVQDAEPVLNPADRNALELAAQLAKAADTTFDAYAAGTDASAALREAAAFGTERLIAIEGIALGAADEANMAAALASALTRDGADVVLCGAATSSYGSGAVGGFLSTLLGAGLRADVVAVEPVDGSLLVTSIAASALARSRVALPVVVAASSYGIKVRAISPILQMRASKKPIEKISLDDLADGRMNSTAPGGVTDGPLESNRTKRVGEVIDGPDAAARAITLVAALRERQLV